MTITDTLLPDMPADPATDYTAEDRAEDDAALGLDTAPAMPAPEKKKPGPPPNPNSARSKRRAAQTRQPAAPQTMAAPRKKLTSTAPAKAPTPRETYRAGAAVAIQWVAQPIAMAGLGMQLGANFEKNPAKQQTMMRHGNALSMDAVTIGMFADELAEGAAVAAEAIPWLAAGLEKAAKIGPYAVLAQAAAGLVLQLLCNHGIVPATQALGTMDAVELARANGIPVEQPAG